MLDINPLIVKHVSPGIVKEVSTNGKLVIFAVENGKDETIAAWADAVKDELERWPNGYSCLFLHDLHKSGMTAFDAHMQEDFQELYQFRPDLKQYVAVVMPADSSAEIARLDVLVRELKEDYTYPVHWEVFTNRKDALEWLLAQSTG